MSRRRSIVSRAIDLAIIVISYFFALSSVYMSWEKPTFNDTLQAFLFGQMGMLFYFVTFRRREIGLEKPEEEMKEEEGVETPPEDEKEGAETSA